MLPMNVRHQPHNVLDALIAPLLQALAAALQPFARTRPQKHKRRVGPDRANVERLDLVP